MDAVIAVENNDNVKAAVLICSGRTFIAETDVKDFDKPAESFLRKSESFFSKSGNFESYNFSSGS